MIEVTGNLWDFPADLTFVTTNGALRRNGNAIMGRGCAREARDLLPTAEESLGQSLRESGVRVALIGVVERPYGVCSMYAYPTKYHWSEKSDLELIHKSALQAVELADILKLNTAVLPRPGVGAGGLSWDEVKSIIESILDDRFAVITF